MLFNRVNDLRKEKLFNQAIITLLEACCNGVYQNYTLHTGPGLKKQEMLRIFEYYYTTKDKGMGLGLPISYMIMKDHGGDIQVRSEEGKGAHFVVALPLKPRGDKKDE